MRILNTFNVAVICFVLYGLQGSLYKSGSIVSQTCLSFCFLVGLYNFVKCIPYCRCNMILTLIMCFVFLNCFSYLFYIGNYKLLADNQLKGVFMCFLPFFMAFHCTVKNNLNNRLFEYLFYVMLVVNILTFYRVQNTLLLDVSSGNVVNNVAYSFARLIPLLFFIRRNVLIRVALLFVIVFFVILGAKRGAMVITGIGVVIYLFFLLKRENVNSNYVVKFISVLLVFGFIYVAIQQIVDNEFLIKRFESGDLSGRDWIYTTIFNSWYMSNRIEQLLFGFGFISSVNMTNGVLAHNDWLEVLSNFGLFGVSIYASLFLSFVFAICKNNMTPQHRYAFITIIFMWGGTSIFSTWYNSIDSFSLMLLLGYIVGTIFVKNELNKWLYRR